MSANNNINKVFGQSAKSTDSSLYQKTQQLTAKCVATSQDVVNDAAAFVYGAAMTVSKRQDESWERAKTEAADIWAQYL